MTTISAERIVERPPADVFRFVATDHFTNHPRWDPDLLEMTPSAPGPMRVGAMARVVRRQGRGRVEGGVTVIAYRPDDYAAFDARFGAFSLLQRVECLPERDGRATHLRLTIETRARWPLKALIPLMRRRFRTTMEESLATIANLLVGGDRAAPRNR